MRNREAPDDFLSASGRLRGPDGLAPTGRTMSFPVYVRLGPLALHPHWIFESLAYTAGFYLYRRLRRRRGDVIESRDRWWVIAAAIVGGFAGSRVLSAFEDPVVPRGPLDAAAAPARRQDHRRRPGRRADRRRVDQASARRHASRPATCSPCRWRVGIAIGRIGCFLTGPRRPHLRRCRPRCRGAWTSATAIAAPPDPALRDRVPRWCSAPCCIGLRRRAAPRRRSLQAVHGRLPRLPASGLSSSSRACALGGLSAIQWVCLAVLAYYAPHAAAAAARTEVPAVADRVRPYLSTTSPSRSARPATARSKARSSSRTARSACSSGARSTAPSGC